MAVSFDLFGTLVAVDRPSDPAAAVATALRTAGIPVPGDWGEAFRERHVDAAAGAEVALPTHVRAALADRGVDAPSDAVTRAVRDAFDAPVTTRPGAVEAVAAARARGPVGLLSNCSVPGLVDRALARSAVSREPFDAVTASVDCGWRKPDRRAFEAVADALGVPVSDLRHAGDAPRTDSGVTAAGGQFVHVGRGGERSLRSLADRLGDQCP